MPPQVQYKFGKADKLDQVAKKYGHKDFKAIWEHKDNRSLVQKRKKPESLQPGDVIIIPPTAKELAELAKRAVALQSEMSELHKFEAYCEGFGKQFEMLSKQNAKAAVEEKEAWTDIATEIRRVAGQTKRVGDTVDIAADISLMFVGLQKLAAASAKSALASGEALEQINKRAAAEAASFASAPVAKVMADGGVQYLKKPGQSMVSVIIGEFGTMFFNLTKPTFWTQAVVTLKEGGSISEALTADIGKDLEKAAKHIETLRDEAIEAYLQQANQLEQRAKEMGLAAKKAAAHFKVLERELKALE